MRARVRGLDLARRNDLCSYYVLGDTGERVKGWPRLIGFLRAFTALGKEMDLERKARSNEVLPYVYLAEGGYIEVQQAPMLDYRYFGAALAADLPAGAECAYDQYEYKLFRAQNEDQEALTITSGSCTCRRRARSRASWGRTARRSGCR